MFDAASFPSVQVFKRIVSPGLWAASLLAMRTSMACAQVGGSGSGGAERLHVGEPTGNRAPASVARTLRGRVANHLARSASHHDDVGFSAFGGLLTVGQQGIVARATVPDTMLRIGGRLHLDAGVVGTHSKALADAFQDTLVRRAFIEAYLTLSKDIEVAFQYDTAPSDAQPLQDAGISYRGLAPFILSVGNFKEPMGLDQLTSDNDTLFLERALPTALTPGRNFGGLAGANGERWTAVAGLWGGDPNTGIADEGASITSRWTWAPILTAEQVLHFGISGSYRWLERNGPRSASEAAVASTPETSLLPIGDALVRTGTIAGATAIAREGFEVAYQYGPVRLQGEANRQTVSRIDHGALTFMGYYAEIGWVLNGDGRPYRIKPAYGSPYATFGGVELADDQRVSQGGFGVFEIATRVSQLDLSDRDLRGGSERNVTFGLNWYPEPNVKIIGNYIHVDAGLSLHRPKTDADILAGRLQFFW